MKRLQTSILTLLAALPILAQGWPQQYGGVMLQGFYWDSYADTRWTNLEAQADELSQYFNLIWVPQSGYCNSTKNQMGYSDIWWLDHRSSFGTEAELRSMIQTFAAKGTGIIADVVINHKNGNTSWCDFPNESKNGYTLTWDNTNFSAICQDDECNNATNLSKWSTNGQPTTGAKDTGDNFDGCRDLDHTNAQVQQNVKTYLNFLLADLGYAGFRYDMVKGYKPEYTGIYNVAAQPAYSVGEYWDGDKSKVVSWLNGTQQNGAVQSAAFDFPMKYLINAAFSNNGSGWSRLNGLALANDAQWARYAVTFVDNHDTERNQDVLRANVEAANAYILCMPGTPCVWLSHWKSNKTAIKKLILVRKAAGLTNQSDILTKEASADGYVLTTKGSKGNVMLLLGSATAPTDGYQLAVEGTNYKVYASNGVDLSALDNVKDDAFTAPDCCTVADGEVCAFFEASSAWTNVHCYVWTGSTQYEGDWPGAACTLVGTHNGKNVWKWSYSGSLTTLPANIIFNNNNQGMQTNDLDFRNGGYYDEAGALTGVVTGIETVKADATADRKAAVYDLGGRRVETPRRGIYIQNGKKIIY